MGFLKIKGYYVYLTPDQYNTLEEELSSDLDSFSKALMHIKFPDSKQDEEKRGKIGNRMIAYLEEQLNKSKKEFEDKYVNFFFSGSDIQEVIFDLLDCYSFLNGFSDVHSLNDDGVSVIPYAVELGGYGYDRLTERGKYSRYICFEQYINRFKSNKFIGKSELEVHTTSRFIIDTEKVISIEGYLQNFVIKQEHSYIYFTHTSVTVSPL